MFVLGNFIIAIAQILAVVLSILWWLILIRALLSWVNPDPFNPIVQFLHRVTEPFLEPVRRFLPYTAIDISPFIVFLFIMFVQYFVVQTLMDIGFRMKM